MTATLVIDDIDPRQLVSANARIHHMVRARVCAHWRTLARDTALATYGAAIDGQPWHEQVAVTITFRFPDKRRHDVGNLYSYVAKPIVDGLVDAGLIPDDDDAHLVGPDLRRNPEQGPHQVSLTVTDLEETR